MEEALNGLGSRALLGMGNVGVARGYGDRDSAGAAEGLNELAGDSVQAFRDQRKEKEAK